MPYATGPDSSTTQVAPESKKDMALAVVEELPDSIALEVAPLVRIQDPVQA